MCFSAFKIRDYSVVFSVRGRRPVDAVKTLLDVRNRNLVMNLLIIGDINKMYLCAALTKMKQNAEEHT